MGRGSQIEEKRFSICLPITILSTHHTCFLLIPNHTSHKTPTAPSTVQYDSTTLRRAFETTERVLHSRESRWLQLLLSSRPLRACHPDLGTSMPCLVDPRHQQQTLSPMPSATDYTMTCPTRGDEGNSGMDGGGGKRPTLVLGERSGLVFDRCHVMVSNKRCYLRRQQFALSRKDNGARPEISKCAPHIVGR